MWFVVIGKVDDGRGKRRINSKYSTTEYGEFLFVEGLRHDEFVKYNSGQLIILKSNGNNKVENSSQRSTGDIFIWFSIIKCINYFLFGFSLWRIRQS